MAVGYRPDWLGQQRYEWCYLYGAIEPLGGRSYFWLLPDLTGESVRFLCTSCVKPWGKTSC